MVDTVPVDIRDETEFFMDTSLRMPRDDSCLDRSLYRNITNVMSGSLAEYHRLEKVFWRDRESGFRIPSNRVVRDRVGRDWLEVEYISGRTGSDVVRRGGEVADDFLCRFGSVAEKVLEHPYEPFPSDVGMNQYLFDGSDWYLVDLEPRVKYLEQDPDIASLQNKNLIRAVTQAALGYNELCGSGEADRAHGVVTDVIGRALVNHDYFRDQYGEPYGAFETLLGLSVTRRVL